MNEVHLHFEINLPGEGQDEHQARHRHAEILAAIHNAKETIMSAIDDLSQNLDDITALVDQILGVIQAGDTLAAELRTQIAALVDAANLSAAEKAALAAKIDAAFAKSVAAEDKLRAAVPQVPPVGGEPLLTTYASNADFTAAVAAYSGPEGVTLDGASVKTGTSPTLDYFSHSADGSVSTSGPTD
jgi:hypothetical protein